MRTIFRDRIERLRELVVERELHGALVFSWRRRTLSWFCGYDPGYATNCAAIWVPAQGPPRAWVRFPFERERMKRETGLDVVGADDFGSVMPEDATNIGLVAGDFAINEWSMAPVGAIHRELIDWTDLSEDVDAWRAIKTSSDVEAASHAARTANDAFTSVRALVRPGVTDFELASHVEAFARSRGAIRALCMVGIGDGVVGSEPYGAVMSHGDVVVLELNIWTSRGCTHVNATMFAGNPLPHQRDAERICRHVRSVLVEAIRPGVPVAQLVMLGDQALQATGGMLAHKEYDFGHGIGLDLPELPKLIASSPSHFLVGNVIAVHVAVREPEGRTAFVGGPIEVTPQGARELVKEAWWIGDLRN